MKSKLLMRKLKMSVIMVMHLEISVMKMKMSMMKTKMSMMKTKMSMMKTKMSMMKLITMIPMKLKSMQSVMTFDIDDIDEECYDFQDELFNFKMIIEYSRD